MDNDGNILLWLIGCVLMIASIVDMIAHNINMMNCMVFVIGMIWFLIISSDIMERRKSKG